MADSNLKSKTIRGLFFKLFEQGGSAMITLLVQIVMARILAPREFGMLAIMLVFVNVGNVLVQSGLNTAIVQSKDVGEKDFSTVFWMSLAVSVVLYVVVFLSAPAVASFYRMPRVVWPLRALVLVLIVNAYNSIQEAIVARDLQFNKTFRATITAGGVSGALGISAALAGFGIWALVVQQIAQQVVKCIALAKQIPWRPRLEFDGRRAVVLFRFSWKLLVSGIMDQLYQSLSDLIIGRVFTSTDLGYVSQGKKYPQALGVMLDGAIQPVMLSAVSRVQEDVSNVKRLARRGLKTSTYLIVPSMTLFAILAPQLVRLLLGAKWLPSVPFLQMYCFVYALLPIHTTNLQVLNGMGRSDLFLRLEVIKKCLGLAIISFAAFVMRDIYAIVFGSVIVGIASTFINASPNKRVIGYSYMEQVRDIVPAFAMSAASAVVVWFVASAMPNDVLGILLGIVVMFAVYVLLSWVFRVEEFGYVVRNLKAVRDRRAAAGK